MHKWDTPYRIAPGRVCNAVFLFLEVFFMENKRHQSIRMLTEGAVLVALAEILSLLPLYKFPWGGSVDLAMLPVVLYCIRWGFGPGLITCTVHAICQALLSSLGGALGWESIVGDYLLAYVVLAAAGCFRGKFVPGAVVSLTLRFLVHYVVGATLWAEWMPETFWGMTMSSPWIYSALYNGAYMVPDLVLVVAAGLVLMATPVKKYFAAVERL